MLIREILNERVRRYEGKKQEEKWGRARDVAHLRIKFK